MAAAAAAKDCWAAARDVALGESDAYDVGVNEASDMGMLLMLLDEVVVGGKDRPSKADWNEERLSFLAESVSRTTGLTGIAGFCPAPAACDTGVCHGLLLALSWLVGNGECDVAKGDDRGAGLALVIDDRLVAGLSLDS